MGQVLHSCATATYAFRTAILRSQISVAELAQQYGQIRKTIRKGRTHIPRVHSVDDMTSAAHMHAQLQILHYEEKQMLTPGMGVDLEYAATLHPRVEPANQRKLLANCDIEKICTPDRRIMSEPRCLRELGRL